MVQIASRDNARVKDAKRVRDGKDRDMIFIEGVRIVEEAIRSQIPIDCLFVSNDGLARGRELIDSAAVSEIYHVTDPVFRSMADTVSSQGMIAIARRPCAGREQLDKRLPAATVPLVVFLHETNNPSNLGAVIRAAEAAGAAGLIVSTGSADAFSSKAVRAAMGSSFRLPIWTEVELGDAIQWAAANDLQTVATETGAKTAYTDVDWTRPRMILLGSEAHGLPAAVIQMVDEMIRIPMEESVESLNLAVACGIILFEARRQNSAR